MLLGFPNNPRAELADEIRWIAGAGFDFIDLFFEPDRTEPANLDLPALKRQLDDAGLARVGHTAPYLPIGSSYRQLRRAAAALFAECADACAELGCPGLTIHTDWPGGLFSLAEGIAFQSETLTELKALATARGLALWLEPSPTWRDRTDNIAALLAANPGVGLHADLGHFNVNGNEPLEALHRFRDRIVHVHVSDNDGRSDAHLPLGAGKIDWGRVIPALKEFYDGTVTLEIFSRDREYALRSRQKFLELWTAAPEQDRPKKTGDGR